MRKILFAAGVAAAGSYGLYHHGILDVGSFSVQMQNWLSATGDIAADLDTKETTVYKVQNPDGTWTYTNQKPDSGAPAQARVYRSDTNVVPAVPSVEKAKAPATRPDKAPHSGPSSAVDPQWLENPLERAKQVEDVLQDRHERRQKIIDGE